MRASERPNWARCGSPSWRSTTPARPRGNLATERRGSANRRSSVKSQSTGQVFGLRVRRALTARAQATSLSSMAPPIQPGEPSIAENLRRVRDRIADAAIKAGRKPEDVTLVAVSKTKPVEAIRDALAAGQTAFGENRVQEAAAKFPLLRGEHQFSLHLIGGLQTNKARDAVRLAEVIETLDRPHLAGAIAAAIAKEGRTPTLLIEVNVGNEPQKAGIGRADADSFIDDCKGRFGVALAGLMCVPPHDEDPQRHFNWLAERAAKHGLPVLSMGMSADFETAIACGATWVRVGSAIFGTR